jgi:hypothetical protein
MVEMCLEALISGVIAINGMDAGIDNNNRVMFTHSGRTEYVIPDKYNEIQLCGQERFAANNLKQFDLIKIIGD